MSSTQRALQATGLVGLLCACGGTLSDAEAMQLRQKLRSAMAEDVGTREKRDEQSRLLVDIVAKGALDGLNEPQVREVFGRGKDCRIPVCQENGFSEKDWYYEVGQATSPDVKQMPLLILGFDPRGRVVKVFAYKTH
jgi:hypothetical protein